MYVEHMPSKWWKNKRGEFVHLPDDQPAEVDSPEIQRHDQQDVLFFWLKSLPAHRVLQLVRCKSYQPERVESSSDEHQRLWAEARAAQAIQQRLAERTLQTAGP
jgi:hypothetical protein